MRSYLFTLAMDELTGSLHDDIPWYAIVLIDETSVGVNSKLKIRELKIRVLS